jgi:replicative DNA helicase
MPPTPPPCDPDAEAAVIGCCLAGPQAIKWASEWLGPTDFYVPKWANAFAAVLALYHSGRKADPLTVADQARQLGYGNLLQADLIGALADAPSIGQVDRYGSIVRRYSVARTGLGIVHDAAADFRNKAKDPDEVIDSLFADLRGIDAHIPSGRPPGYMTFEELRAKPVSASSPWVLGASLLRQDWRCMFVGPEGTGKTLLLRQIAVCGAAGFHPLKGKDVPIRQIRTLLVDLENPEDHLKDWIDRLSRHAEAWRRFTEGRGAIWHRPGGVDLRKRTDRSQFEEVLRLSKPELVCLGPLYKAFRRRSNETDEQAAGEMQEILDDLRTRYGFGLILEHHAPKEQGGERTMLPFGSSLWLRWGEIRMGLKARGRSAPGWDQWDHKWPIHSLAFVPFSGSRIEGHGWPKRIDRNPDQHGLPWLGSWEPAPE